MTETPDLQAQLSSMSDDQILDLCDWLTDEDPVKLLREVIPFLVRERSQSSEVAMRHQCTPDYEMGEFHGEAATRKVCRERYGKCLHDYPATELIKA